MQRKREVNWAAVARNDRNEALRHVAVGQRDAFSDQFEGGLRVVLPADFQLQLESVEDKSKAQVQVVGTEVGIDLVYENSRWWVSQ